MKSKKRKIESHDSNPAKKPRYKEVSIEQIDVGIPIPDKLRFKNEHAINPDSSSEEAKAKSHKHKTMKRGRSKGPPEKTDKPENEQSQLSTDTAGHGDINSVSGGDESMKKSSTCMKHKKKDKKMKHKKKDKKSKKHKHDKSIKTGYEKNKEGSSTVLPIPGKVDPDKIRIPQAAEEISMNWREMLKQMAATRKPAVKQSQKQEHNKQWKLNYRKKNRSHEDKEMKKDQQGISSGKLDVWFDGVDSILLECQEREPLPIDPKNNPLLKKNSFSGLTHIIGMDCEMVGIGENGEDSILARISMVNHYGHCLYDKYVKPTEKVTDYRTFVSGIRPNDIANGEEFKVVQEEVSNMLKGRLLVGHAVHNDLEVLFLNHPKKMIRDTSRYKGFRSLFGGRTPSLKKLTEKVLGVKIQEGEHSSVQDAQAAMKLYTMHRKAWEKELKEGHKHEKTREKEVCNEEDSKLEDSMDSSIVSNMDSSILEDQSTSTNIRNLNKSISSTVT